MQIVSLSKAKSDKLSFSRWHLPIVGGVFMSRKTPQDKLADIRSFLFDAVDAWNVDHPQRLPSHREHASVCANRNSEKKTPHRQLYDLYQLQTRQSTPPWYFMITTFPTLLWYGYAPRIEQKNGIQNLCRRFAQHNIISGCIEKWPLQRKQNETQLCHDFFSIWSTRLMPYIASNGH